MKALSIKQPWAWAILHAGKDVENRDWPTLGRGRIALHASAGMTRSEYLEFLEVYGRIVESGAVDVTVPDSADLERGAIIATFNLVGCVKYSPSPWFFGKYGFVLEDVTPLPEPIPCSGKLGFWEVPTGIVEQINEALKR